MNILLDMDGVLADFVTSACEAHDYDPSQMPWDECGFHMEKGMGLTADEFWAPINDLGRGFWTDLRPYPWLNALLLAVADLASEYGASVHLCTSPSRIPECQAGKIDWIYQHLPKALHHGYVFTSHKHLLARPDAVLIDDGIHNVMPFGEAGGHTILFPQPYNVNADQVGREVAFVQDSLDFLLSTISQTHA